MDLQNVIEIGVGGVLTVSFATLVFLAIGRKSAFKLIEGQLGRFKNKTELQIELKKSMTMIYIITSISVYFGLLGTVLGLVAVLSQINNTSEMGGLIAALAFPLLSTAASLVVAIVGSILYYILSDDIDTVEMKWDIHHGHAAQSKGKKRASYVEDEQDVFED